MKNGMKILSALLLTVAVAIVTPVFAFGADRLIVKNGSGTKTFVVEDSGATRIDSSLVTNGAAGVGIAPFVLGQDIGKRGIVITDKAATNPKRVYIGWNVGSSHDYAEIFALQEGVAWKNLVFVPHGGNVGIGTTNPSHPLQMGSGAYVSTGGVWTNASSRKYKTDIKQLTAEKAMTALTELKPVEFVYKADGQEKHVGFIAEDAPVLVATKDRKGMSSMDVVAVLTKVVQEQQKTVQEQRATIAELSRRLTVVEKGIKTIK